MQPRRDAAADLLAAEAVVSIAEVSRVNIEHIILMKSLETSSCGCQSLFVVYVLCRSLPPPHCNLLGSSLQSLTWWHRSLSRTSVCVSISLSMFNRSHLEDFFHKLFCLHFQYHGPFTSYSPTQNRPPSPPTHYPPPTSPRRLDCCS